MTDQEIETALGHPIKDDVIDAEVVEPPDESEGVPSTTGPMNNPEVEQTPAISFPVVIPTLAPPRWSEEWWNQARPEVQSRRCKAHKKTGERCLKAAIDGATVCRVHGGAARHVKAAARARLENAADLMAQELLGMATAGESETVRLSAIRDALDRAGLAKPTQVEIGPLEPKPYEDIMFDAITTETRAESRARRGLIDENSAGNEPDAQSCNPPTQSETGTQPRPTSVGRNEAATTPAEQGGERSQEREGNHQFPKGSTGYDGAGAGTGQLVRQNPWQPSPDAVYTDPDSGEPMTADEMVLYVARRMNEKAGTPPVQAELSSPHRRYRAHRRSIY